MDEPKDIPTPEQEFDIIPYEEPAPKDPTIGGARPKKLKAVEVYGYEVGRGNRKKIVNPDDVYKLAALGCNTLEIARWFDINKDTLQYTFGDMIDKGREDLKMQLRHAMLKNALGGNAVMQIWLSKNLLGFQDNPTNSEANAPLPFNDAGL